MTFTPTDIFLPWLSLKRARENAHDWRQEWNLCREELYDAENELLLRTAQRDDALSKVAPLEAALQSETDGAHYLETLLAEARAKIAPFDRDGNGSPGGSKPKGRKA